MRKITVALEESVYNRLIDYVAANSKAKGGRLSVSGSASELISGALANLPRQAELEAR
jgi:hypothetical protein